MRILVVNIALAVSLIACGDNLAPDTTAPTVEITGGPDGAINSTTPTFTFTLSDDAAIVECSVDSATAAPCTSPVTTAPLDQGAHTFTVTALDKAGKPGMADRSFIVDTVQPMVMITGGPNGLMNNATPAWTFVTTDNPTVVECSVDGGAAAACAGSFTASHLADGDHTFAVHVADAAGNNGMDTRSISLDTVAPVVTITGGPSATTFDTTPTFTFTIAGTFASSQCRIDAAAFVACTDTYTPSVLGGGSHTFEVKATDAAGNAGDATRTFAVDTSAPTISITSDPGAFTNNPTPAFTFVAGATATTVQCQIDGGAFADCTSPFTAPTLGEGSHTFEVQACTATPACANDSRTFAVDLTPPEVTITSGPADPTPTSVAQPAFGFTVTGAATSGCRITSIAVPTPAYTTCATSYTASATLVDGAYAFEILATDAAGNFTHATRAFTVDTTVPVVVAVVPLIAARTSLQTPFVFFAATDTSTVTTTCAIDAGVAVACDGTLGFHAAANLPEGTHVYHVIALDAAGNTGLLDVSFVVDVTPPTVTITGGTTDPTTDTTPTFIFTTSADTTHVRCALDSGEVLDPCTSGEEFPTIAAGSHTVTITASDDATPANTANGTKTFVLSICGDGVIHGGEQCEGSNLNGSSCTALGHDSGTLACDPATCKFVETGCGDCGNGVIDGSEDCDGALLAGATCSGLGGTSGTVSCSSSCQFDQSECFAPAGTGFTGPACYGGLKYNTQSSSNIMACSQTAGVFRYATATPTTPEWTPVNGTGTTSIADLNGRAIYNNTLNASIGYMSDSSIGNNAYRSTDAATSGIGTWPTNQQGAFGSVGQPTKYELFGAQIGTGSHGTMYGGWSPVTGLATMLHGSNTATTIVAHTLGPNSDGSSPTGYARSFASTSNDTVAVTDLYVAVFGQTPTGAAATGGIYWSCNTTYNSTAALFLANQGTTIERDTGISAADRDLVWTLTGDPSSVASTPARSCAGTASVASVGSFTLTSSVATGTTATFTTSANHGFAINASVVIAGVTGGGCITGTSGTSCVSPYNGTWTITDVPSLSTFTATLTTAPTGPEVDVPISYNTTYYAGLRGGNSVYKTTNGGASWAIANTGIPTGTEVFEIAIDCWRTTIVNDLPNTTCVNPQSLWAATSDGLYHSTDGAGSWTQVAFAGVKIRSVTLDLRRAAANTPPPKIFLGVEDAFLIYKSN